MLRRGDPVIVDLVGGHEGYLADQTRTFAIGTLAATCVRRLRRVRRDPARGRGRAAPGRGAVTSCSRWSERDGRRRPGWRSTSWAPAPPRVRFLGHGVGLEIDELPILAPGFDEPIVEGHVIAIEPKIVFPGRGAVGIENMYAVTAAGFETITTAPEELIET